MPSETNEQALESTIERRLTGSSLEGLKAKGISIEAFADRKELYRTGNGYYIGSPADFNPRLAIDEVRLFAKRGNMDVLCLDDELSFYDICLFRFDYFLEGY